MKNNITDILREWFYRLPKGYAIEPYNKTELQVLSKVLVENNIDPKPIIESLDQAFLDAKPVEEAPQNIPYGLTEIFHESFFAFALAEILDGRPLSPDKFYMTDESGVTKEKQGTLIDFNDLLKRIKNNPFLLEGDKILSDLKSNEKWLVYPKEDGTKPFRYQNINYKGNSDFEEMFEDAIYSAERVYQALQSYGGDNIPPNITGVKRMTGKRADGTKPVEDSVVYIQTPEGVEETVLISLKLGKGQFGSLSTKQVLELAFGITGDDTTKLFKTMRNAGYTDGIDKTLSVFITTINNTIDEIYGGDIAKAASDSKPISKNDAKKSGHNIQVVADLVKSIPDQHLINGKVDPNIPYETYQNSKIIRDVYRKLYGVVQSLKRTGPYVEAKKDILLPSIDQFFKDKATTDTNLTEMVKYILRADEKFAYLYVASSGKSSHVIPSRKQIEARAKEIDVKIKKYKTSEADYLRDVDIIDKSTGTVLISIPNKFRWGFGQFNGEMNNYSSAPTFSKEFAGYFGGWGYSQEAPDVTG